MTHTWRDSVADALVAAVALTYLVHLTWTDAPYVDDVRGAAAVAFVLGIASRWVGGRGGFKHQSWAIIGNFGSIALGVATFVTGSGAVLAAFVASILALWAAATFVRLSKPHLHHPVAH